MNDVTTPEPLSGLPILMLESKVCRSGDVNEWQGRYGLIFSLGPPLLSLWPPFGEWKQTGGQVLALSSPSY